MNRFRRIHCRRDPLQLRRRLAVQGGGFALLLLAAFSGSLYWGIASQRQEDQRTELRQLAASAAAQLPLIAHETREAEGSAKFRAGPRLIDSPALQQQRLQWFDAKGSLLSEQGGLAVPFLPGQPRSALASARGISVPIRALWQRWPGGMSLWQPVDSQAERLGYVRVALSDQAARADLSRIKRGLLLGGVVTVLAALLVGRRMLRMAFLPLQRQVSALQRFSADASHELRHPLTALRTQLAAVPPELRQHPGLAWPELDMATNRQVQVAVRDQGPGIPSAQQEQVFERFWSGADRGGHSGLGLAIGRAIARRHGGELRLGESRPGLCVLLVELPAAVNPPQTS
ncbi:MAG: ATP-binding protein [Synechococcaceae cyanobacterium ELA263]